MATRKQKLITQAEALGLATTANMTANDIEELITDAESAPGDMDAAVAEATGSAPTDAPPASPPDPAPTATRRRRSSGTKRYKAKMNVKGVSPGGVVRLTAVEAAPLIKMGNVLEAL